jgi:hypothetical protein
MAHWLPVQGNSDPGAPLMFTAPILLLAHPAFQTRKIKLTILTLATFMALC